MELPVQRHRFQATIAGALAAGVMLTATSSAGAATIVPADIDANPRGGALDFGTATWKLKGKPSGVTIKGTGSGDDLPDVKGSKLSFQASTDGTVIDPTTMRGQIVLGGGLSIKGSKTAKLTVITLQPGIEQNVTAKLGGKLVELGSLKGGKVSFAHQADGALKGATLKLSASGAKKLKAATGASFRAGTFASVDAATTTRELPLASGVAKLTLNPDLLKLVTDAGSDITTAAGATRDGLVISIPLTSGAFDPENATGRMSLDGDVVVGKPGTSVRLFGWRVAVTSTQHSLYANINDSIAAPIADIDLSKLTAGTNQDGTFYGTGGSLTVSKIASSTLKQSFGITVPVGFPMGTVDLAGQLSGK
jgi:hypothetical protein